MNVRVIQCLATDITIVGSGVAGLWAAKMLVDQGLKVVLVEKAAVLASGATTRNEGWLHAGTYHAVGIVNEADALRVTERTIYGHDAIVAFAPESIEHGLSFALACDDEIAQTAITRWARAGVEYQEVTAAALCDREGLAADNLAAAFQVKDKSINSRILCQNLAHYVVDRGGRILTSASFIPVDSVTARVKTAAGSDYLIKSGRFLITAGSGIKDLVNTATGVSLPMRFFKAHLLVYPRLTNDNVFCLGVGEAGIMNHGRTSVVGINRDGIELPSPNYAVVPEKVDLIRTAVNQILPGAIRQSRQASGVMAVSCVKPDLYGDLADVQNLNVCTFAFPGYPEYLCALPGKMTEAPYLAKVLTEMLATSPSAKPGSWSSPLNREIMRLTYGQQISGRGSTSEARAHNTAYVSVPLWVPRHFLCSSYFLG